MCYNLSMEEKPSAIQRTLLVFFVLFVSFGLGWYAQKAIEKFMANHKDADDVSSVKIDLDN